MSNWQPIETAPRDGREILVVLRLSRRITVAWWSYSHQVRMWEEHSGDLWVDAELTHWHPLPDPPTGTERGLQS